jgi:hypothetical protein
MENPSSSDSSPQDVPDPQFTGITPDSPAPPVDHLPTAPLAPKRKRRRYIASVLLAVVLIALGIGIGLHVGKDSTAKNTAIQQPAKQPAKAVNSSLSASGYQFYATPQKLANLNFFQNLTDLFGTECDGDQTTNCPPLEVASDISYYQIGLTKSKQPIIVAVDYTKGVSSFFYVALQTSPGQYEVLGKLKDGLDPTVPNDQSDITTLKNDLSPNVSLNTTDTIPDFNFPQNQTIKGQGFTLPDLTGPPGYFINGLSGIRGPSFNSPVPSSDITNIGQANGITFYEVTAEDQADYQVKEIYGVVGGVFAAAYVPADPLTSSTAPSIQWQSGSSDDTSIYASVSQGCGSPLGYLVAKNLDPQQLTQVGEGPDETPLYELPTTSALFNDYYATDYAGGADLAAGLQQLSATQFQADHAVMVAKNALGQYVIYERQDFVTAGGCGKPVIYLYPQQPTTVSIKIGADVTASDPAYTQNGWQDITALPGSTLTYQGQTYNSLFWEGLGLGPYPAIDSGTVVPRAKLVSTIRQQLQAQGLTTQETDDFLAYWQPKLPTTPYTRLTWLDTAQMNALAPLQVTPKPTTTLRVFLDFQGLYQPIAIKPQTLHTTPRIGFTLVEWGGLLRDN